jgi:hypothetical protein
MNGSSRNPTRVDRIAAGAVFVTTLLIVSVSASMTLTGATSLVAGTDIAACQAVAAHVAESDDCATAPRALATANDDCGSSL